MNGNIFAHLNIVIQLLYCFAIISNMTTGNDHSSLTEEHAFMILNEFEQQILELLHEGERLSVNEIAESVNQDISTTNALMIQLELKHYLKKAIDAK